MQGGLLVPVGLPHPMTLNTPSWSAHTTERVRKPPPHVLVHCTTSSECVFDTVQIISEKFELTADHWPIRYENICGVCLFTCNVRLYSVVRVLANTCTKLHSSTKHWMYCIGHWDVIITHLWYGVCSISSDYCSAMSNREYLYIYVFKIATNECKCVGG